LNIDWQFSRTLTLIDLLCFVIFEGFDHDYIV
jgi:hypothetical protein